MILAVEGLRRDVFRNEVRLIVVEVPASAFC